MTAITRDTDARGRLTEIHHRRIQQKNPSRAISVESVFVQVTQVYLGRWVGTYRLRRFNTSITIIAVEYANKTVILLIYYMCSTHGFKGFRRNRFIFSSQFLFLLFILYHSARRAIFHHIPIIDACLSIHSVHLVIVSEKALCL